MPEGQSVPLPLPWGDAEGLALCDGDRDARGEAELLGVPVGCAGVPLCVGDAAALPCADAVGRGVGEGRAVPDAAAADPDGGPLALGEREPDGDAAADGDAEGEGRAEGGPRAVSDANGDGEISADADCGGVAVGATVAPPLSLANRVAAPLALPAAVAESGAD